jgi:hypothetical protein
MVRPDCKWDGFGTILHAMKKHGKSAPWPVPGEALVADLNQLFQAAADRMPSPKGSGLRFPTTSPLKGARKALRRALGLQESWSDWCKGEWPADSPYMHVTYTEALVKFLGGSPEHNRKFKVTSYLQNAKEIHGYLVSDQELAPKVEDTRKRLETYLSTLLQLGRRAPIETGSAHAVARDDNSEPETNFRESLTANVECENNYVGMQCDANLENRRIVGSLDELRHEQDARIVPAGLRALEYKVRTRPPSSNAYDQEKQTLYGGRSDLSLGFTVHDYVAANFAFQRSISEQISNAIIEADDSFTSHTIVARRGQGKSIALAQILARLSSTAGFWTFWSINDRTADPRNKTPDPENTSPFVCEEDRDGRAVKSYFRLLEHCGCVPRRLVFLFDDFSNRQLADARAISRFHRLCEDYAKQENRAISFVLSASHRSHSLSSPKNTLALTLDEADEQRLYTMLVETKPNWIKKRYPLDKMLSTFLEEKRHIKDDVQSFADFIIRNSTPLDEFTPRWWFSDLQAEPQASRKVLPIIAASQLLDLALPAHIAHHIAGLQIGLTKNLTDMSSRISPQKRDDNFPAEDQWDGYVLSSAYQARSLLDRERKLNALFLREAFLEIVSLSLARAKDQLDLWFVTDEEYLRHLLHRLSKKDHNRLSGLVAGPSLAAELFATYGETIVTVLRRHVDSNRYARWAGTLSRLGAFSRLGADGQFGGDRQSPERYVCELCCEVIALGVGSVNSPQAFVLLMKAIESLCRSFDKESQVIKLAQDALRTIDLDIILSAALDEKDSQQERRANEVLHVYVSFLLSVPDADKREVRSHILRLYENAEKTLLGRGVRLDAANYLKRSDVLIPRYGMEGRYDNRDVELCAHYLRLARQTVLSQFREQGLWRRSVERSVRTFERRFHRSIEKRNEAVAKSATEMR